MPLVVSDTSPLRYLVQISHIDLLPRLFETLRIPSSVREELIHPSAPAAIRDWIVSHPDWLNVSIDPPIDPALRSLDPGERAAIALGLTLSADLVLMDDRKGANAARERGLLVVGTLGILDLAGRKGMIDFGKAIEGLKRTNFRVRARLLNDLVRQHQR